jgi:hypothetical protein
MSDNSKFEGWAVVEMMGHRRLAGHVTQVEMGIQAMLRVDVPAIEFEVSEWAPIDGSDGLYKNFTKKFPEFTTFVSPASLYALTPVSEEFARKSAIQFRITPPGFVDSTTTLALPAPESPSEDDEL